MTLALPDATIPAMFTDTLGVMARWLDKAAESGDEAALLTARLAPDMHPLTFQYQTASDTAKGAIARLAGVEAPAMADDEASFADLRARCQRTIAFIREVDAGKLAGAGDRSVELRFRNGLGYRFDGVRYLTGFALPNFFFHATAAYAILRQAGVPLGKPDFLQHLGAPNLDAAA